MKLTSHLTGAFLSAVFCLTLTQCAGDSTQIFNVDVNGGDAYIRLALSVEGTRAEGDDDDDELTVIDIYVFDEGGVLETHKTINNETDPVEVTSGYKTVYAIAGMRSDGFPEGEGPVAELTTLNEFEKLMLLSSSDYLFNDNGSLMTGKSNPTQIIKSTATDIPATNIIPIKLVRAMAKATVKFETGSFLDIQFSDPTFCICQTSDLMPVAELASTVTHEKGDGFTYTNFSNPFDGEKLKFVSASATEYMAENISATHVSGNTTFLAIAIKAVPQKAYVCSESGQPNEDPSFNSNGVTTFYAVGVESPATGVVTYATNDAGDPYCFVEPNEASKYATALNATTRASDGAGPYKSIEFTEGLVYYRVHINTKAGLGAEYGKYSVLRNKSYTIDIKTINKLGSASESMLFPTDPETPAEITSAYLNAQFTITPWDDVNQETVL